MGKMTYSEYREILNYEIFNEKKYNIIKKIRILSYPSRKSVWIFRTSQFFYFKPIFRFIGVYFHRKLITKYGIFISPNCLIKKGLKLPHPNGIVIGETVRIGNNCTIYQQVTVGSKNRGDYIKGLQPCIGNNVILFSGCKVLGSINISNGTTVGSNSVLTKSTECNSVYAGIPAKKVK